MNTVCCYRLLSYAQVMRVERGQGAVFLYSQSEIQEGEVSVFPLGSVAINKRSYFSVDDIDVVKSLPPRDLRVYSRRTLLAFQCLFALDFAEQLKGYARDRVGLYLTGVSHVFPIEMLRAHIDQKQSLAVAMRNHFPPKYGLTNNLSITPAHLSIFWGTSGPTNAFLNRHWGVTHAIQRACDDLQTGAVDLGVVLGSFTMEGDFSAWLATQKHPKRLLRESAFGLLLKREHVAYARAYPAHSNIHEYTGEALELQQFWQGA